MGKRAMQVKAVRDDVRRAGRAALCVAGAGLMPLLAPVAAEAQPLRLDAPPTVAQAGCTPSILPLIGLGTAEQDRLRLLQVTGLAPYDPQLLQRGRLRRGRVCAPDGAPAGGVAAAGGAVAGLLPVTSYTAYRSGYPGGGNEGALWQGRGLSTALSAGAHGSLSLAGGLVTLSGQFAPVIAYQQNREFELVPLRETSMSPYANPWYGRRLDIPQRFGDAAFTTIDPGQSHLSLAVGPAELGASTENLWVGPSIRNALLLSNNAPGIPHGYLRTARPLNIGIGAMRFEMLVGQLRHSDYFLATREPGKRIYTALLGELDVRTVPGLALGAARTFARPWPDDPSIGNILGPLFENFFTYYNQTDDNPRGNSLGNQQFSLFGRWAFPASNAEVWGEWGREDHSANWTDFFQEPDHSQAYTLGFQYVHPLASSALRFQVERTSVQRFTPARQERANVTWYAHAQSDQSHRGRVLGAMIGPGADSHWLAFDLIRSAAMVGVYVERVRRHESAYYRFREYPHLFMHDVEMTGGLRGALPLGPLALEWGAALSHRWNRDLMADDGNAGLTLRATWTPPSAAVALPTFERMRRPAPVPER
jgi:hypothetical protein